jgi:hypothetical protein
MLLFNLLLNFAIQNVVSCFNGRCQTVGPLMLFNNFEGAILWELGTNLRIQRVAFIFL